MIRGLTGAIGVFLGCVASAAEPLPVGWDVYVVGEIHDNPAHHAFQAEAVRFLNPTAVVFEMLLPSEAAALHTHGATEDLLAAFHWPNIQDYRSIMTASGATIVGAALPRDAVRAAFEKGAAGVFTGDPVRFGLHLPLPPAELLQRTQLQFEAHCQAMPRHMMTGLVEAQRLRDAHFAQIVLETLGQHGPPVVLITGNGHARRDWGVPTYLARAAPNLQVYAVAQVEDDQKADGGFDEVRTAPPPERADPCAAFR